MKRTKLVYMWEVTYDTNEKKVIKQDLWFQFTKEEAAQQKKERTL